MREHLQARRTVMTCLIVVLLLIATAFAAGIWTQEGDKKKTDNGLTIDYSYCEDGYVIASAKPSSSRLKLRVTCGDVTYNYDLDESGKKEVIPLQLGNGKYTFQLYKNVSGSKYSKTAEVSLSVKLSDANNCFLCPSQYVNYSASSHAVQKASELCEGLTTDEEKFLAIKKYLISNLRYDFVRGLQIDKSYLGDIDGCLDSKTGLCQDFAALAACMLRSEGIPTKLAIGKAGKSNHAWNYVLINGEYRLLDITAEIGGIAKNAKYSLERVY